MKRAGLALVAAALAFVAITGIALESGGVAVVTSTAPGGALRETHVWFVELDGETWLEAGAPENPWFVDAQAAPRLRIRFPDGAVGHFRAEPARDAASQRRIREALHAKYGWRDAWVGMFVDASRSVAVRLVAE